MLNLLLDINKCLSNSVFFFPLPLCLSKIRTEKRLSEVFSFCHPRLTCLQQSIKNIFVLNSQFSCHGNVQFSFLNCNDLKLCLIISVEALSDRQVGWL